MTEIDNDKFLHDFFAENKQGIADNGFSHRVMHHLFDRNNRPVRIWGAFIMTMAAVFFAQLSGSEAVWGTIREVFIGIINHGTTSLDPKSIITAIAVLLFMATRKVASMTQTKWIQIKSPKYKFPGFLYS